MSLPTELPLLPFDQATESQRTEALLTARQAVAAAFPAYSYPQWQQALALVRPCVQPGPAGEPARLLPAELVALLQQLVQPPTDESLAAALPIPIDEPLAQKPDRKQTYQVSEALIEQVDRISFWRRLSITQLVTHGLTYLVQQYPAEAARPIPASSGRASRRRKDSSRAAARLSSDASLS